MARATLSADQVRPGPAGRNFAALASQVSWVLFDASRSPYNVLVNIFVFSAYFATVVIKDPVHGQAVWSYTSAAIALLVAAGAPVLGAVADAAGRRRPWLAGCLILGVPSMMCLWFATPNMQGHLGAIIVTLILAGIAFEYAGVFSSAMLRDVASPGYIGVLGGLGFFAGNLLNALVFVFFLLAWSWTDTPLFGLDKALHEPERATGILGGLCFALFGLPLLIWTGDSRARGQRLRKAIPAGLHRVAATLGTLRQHPNVFAFLVARVVFNEGFMVIMLFTGVYAAGALGWTSSMLTVQGLANSAAASVAGLLAGWLDVRIGARRSTIAFLMGALLADLLICSVTRDSVLGVHFEVAGATGLYPGVPDKVFFAAESIVALCVTGGFVASRTFMAKLSPPAHINEFFGLFALSGTATTFIGPLITGVVTTVLYSQRAGFASGVLFLAAGLLLMARVGDGEGGSGELS